MTAPIPRHLTRADYSEMTWANGRGTTTELLREPVHDGPFLWRLSMASMTEDGPFSLFPNVNRNLTVIHGPGFDLVGDTTLRADPLCPVAFPGDVPITAKSVTGRAIDFNVMTHRSLPKPVVTVVAGHPIAPLPGATLCLFALGPAQVADHRLMLHDLLYNAPAALVTGGPVLAIQMFWQANP